MKKLLFVFVSFCLAGELEVDGDLKVTGTVDAQGKPTNTEINHAWN